MEPPSPQSLNTTRKSHPCKLCQQRKVKCDRKEPCSNCVKAQANCVAAVPTNPRRRKKRFPEAELLARLRRYEEVLRSYGANLDEINSRSLENYVKKSKAEATSLLDKSLRGITLDEEPSHSSGTKSSDLVRNVPSTGISEEFRDTEELLQGSSDDELIKDPIMSTYDRSFLAGGAELLFGIRPQNIDLTPYHPSPVHVFQLWQTFLNNINPLLKLLHAPTVQQQILQASADLQNASKSMQVLLFCIYYHSVTSLNDTECQSLFGSDKSSLLAKYQYGAQQALLNAAFMNTSDIMILQGLTLYLYSALHIVDPRSLFCLTGIAVRIGQRLDLDHDGAGKFPPFQVEMKRRLWWQIALLDKRVSELTGSNYSILTQSWTTKFPLNVNDSDLYPDMHDPPVSSTGATEMTFCLVRCEIAEFTRLAQQERNSFPTASERENSVGKLREHIETQFLQHCDLLIPMHLMTILMARTGINKLQLFYAHHPRRIVPNQDATISQSEKDVIFTSAIEMLEYHNLMLSSKSTQGYLWFINKNFPFPAHIHLIWSLRTRTTDSLADRAWQAVNESIERRFEQNFLLPTSPLHLASSNLTIKAWEAREVAFARMGVTVPVPSMIAALREKLVSRRKASRTADTHTSSNAGSPTGFEQQFSSLHQRFGPDQFDTHNDPAILSGTGMNDHNQESMEEAAIDWNLWDEMIKDFDMDGVPLSGQQQNPFQK